MKNSLLGISVITLLTLIQGCSQKTPLTAITTSPHTANHNQHLTPNSSPTSSTSLTSENNEHSQHQNHQEGKEEKSINTQAKLNIPQDVTPNKPVNLIIDITDTQGKAINKFDKFQEKIMHLIIVSDDLRFFDHVHPDYKNNGNGSFQVKYTFPAGGEYTLFSDYKPAESNERVSVMKTSIKGTIPLPKSLEKFEQTKTLSDTKVTLNVDNASLKARKDIMLKFKLVDNKNQPIKDLQPYLGEKAHLVTIKSSSPLTNADYIHSHGMKDSAPGEIDFHAKFPQAGTYKMWLQFQRNGNVKTADFWVNVK
ncbi:hypothetical protein H6F32_06130 [Anabaena sp. FACHB-1237]|uniref:hypothetical protein n=1 Tax=Anabaena sp. FACHB-1237 TaxID=2692769 RepID=UPI00168096AF|nr:hypothetical protein [Anabaena sp. FACHB-1237]MBD2137169.1 hypothetical protein [Anabaena sp. FACHB-1237]